MQHSICTSSSTCTSRQADSAEIAEMAEVAETPVAMEEEEQQKAPQEEAPASASGSAQPPITRTHTPPPVPVPPVGKKPKIGGKDNDDMDEEEGSGWDLQAQVSRMQARLHVIEIVNKEHAQAIYSNSIRMEKPMKSGKLKDWHDDVSRFIHVLDSPAAGHNGSAMLKPSVRINELKDMTPH